MPRNILSNFIVIEGIDGSGTTTQANLLSQYCQEKQINYWHTQEPTDNHIGKLIRRMLREETIPSKSLANLFVADRADHLYGFHKNTVSEHLKREEIVICERYIFSSLAYQSLDLPIEYIQELNKDFPLPEYLIFIDVASEMGDKRLNDRDYRDIFEKEDTLSKVRANYLRIIPQYKELGVKIIFIEDNGEKNPQEISLEIISELQTILK